MKKIYLIYFTILIIAAIPTYHAFAQERVITGTVADTVKKEMLVSASVTVLTTSTGVTTSVGGKFKITIPKRITSPKLVVFLHRLQT